MTQPFFLLLAAPSCAPNIPLDLVLVVDSSGSVRDQNDHAVSGPDDPRDNWQRLMTALWDLTWQFQQESTRVGIVLYSTDATIVTPLTDPDSARRRIDEIRNSFEGGLTNTAAGIRKAQEILQASGNRPDAHDVVMVFTDGIPTVNAGDVEFASRDVRNFGAFVGVVGIGGDRMNSIQDYTVQRIAARESDVIFVPSFQALPDKVATAATMICSHLLNQAGGCVQGNCSPSPFPSPSPVPPPTPDGVFMHPAHFFPE